jgi:hypothetical protein
LRELMERRRLVGVVWDLLGRVKFWELDFGGEEIDWRRVDLLPKVWLLSKRLIGCKSEEN